MWSCGFPPVGRLRRRTAAASSTGRPLTNLTRTSGSGQGTSVEIREAVIVDTLRTPIGKRKGALAGWQPSDLLAFTLQRLVERTGVDPERIDDVVGGCVSQGGEQGCNVTRKAWGAAGFPPSGPWPSVAPPGGPAPPAEPLPPPGGG